MLLQTKKELFQTMQAFMFGIHWHSVLGMSKAWANSNKWLRDITYENSSIKSPCKLLIASFLDLFMLSEESFHTYPTFPKHSLFVLVGVRIMAWVGHRNGFNIYYPFTFIGDLSQFLLVAVWENTEEKLPLSHLLLDKVFLLSEWHRLMCSFFF